MRRSTAVVLLTLALAACDGEDPITSATREVSAANHAAAALAWIEAEAGGRENDPTPAASCDVEVSFGSFGAGVDTALHGQILALIRANPEVIDSREEGWGREGESTLCLRLKDETAANRLYGAIAAQLPSTSTRAPTTVRHRDGRSRSATYPVAR